MPAVVQVASNGTTGNSDSDKFMPPTHRLLDTHRELVASRGAVMAMHLIHEGVGLSERQGSES